MTSPDVNEFMRQLDQDPELLEQVRARILTRELLRLPETVAQLSEKVARQAETVDQLARRLDQRKRLTSWRGGSINLQKGLTN